jgi:dolichol-phosphate mannosyltransferase
MTNSPGKELSVVIPFYNEEGNLAELYRRLTDSCSKSTIEDYELVFVNDGSTDHSWSLLRAFAQKDTHVLGFSLSRNYGHQIALTAGLKWNGELDRIQAGPYSL